MIDKHKTLINRLATFLGSQRHARMELSWLTQAFTPQTSSPEHLSDMLRKAVDQRINENKPLNYIIGNVPFLDLTLNVEPPILIPRPETEEIVAWMIESLKPHAQKPLSILDLCTGSGCIALALAHAFPTSTVVGIDINEQAIALAQKNAEQNNITNATFLVSDIFAALEGESFDLIVSNPPYIDALEWDDLDKGVTEWEDKKALIPPHNQLFFYQQITEQASRFLRASQLPYNLLFEIGHRQKKAVSDLLALHSFSKVLCCSDLNRKDRWIVAKR